MHQLVRASAGSGKTWQLSGYFLKQLLRGARPESILATTFTRKAAGEILGRVLIWLARAARDPEFCQEIGQAIEPLSIDCPRAQELLQQVTGQLHRLRVSTLDSFFQQIARSCTLELGLPPGWMIVDEHTDRMLRRQAVDIVLAEQETAHSRRLMQMLARGNHQRSVRTLIDDAISNAWDVFQQTTRDAWTRVDAGRRLTSAEREAAVAVLKEFPHQLPGKRMPEAITGDIDRFESEQWEEFVKKGLASALLKGKTTYHRQDIPEEIQEAYRPLLRHARAEILQQVAGRNEATYELISRFDEACRQLRQETGFTRFGDITRLLAQSEAAVDGRRIDFRLDSSLRYLLLDEFQDTSLQQWQVIRRLVRSLAEDGNDGSTGVFCVGDTKQAIYGWRGGVAEIMDRLESAVPGIDVQQRHVSYRSSPAVIEAVNHICSNLGQHPNLKDYEAACQQWSQTFPPHTTARTTLPGYAEVRTLPVPDAEDAADRKSQSDFIPEAADCVSRLHQQTPAAQIGVLVRSNDEVARLVHQLTERGVPASEEGGTPPVDSPAVLAVLSFLHVVGHPGCRVSRFHVAQSPLAEHTGLTCWEDDALAARVSASFRRRLTDDGYGATLQDIALAVSPVCSERDRLRLQQVVAEARRFDLMPALNPADFLEVLESARFSRTTGAPVRVMTIHQSKGLEFEIVVAPIVSRNLFRVPSLATGGPDPAEPPESVCTWISSDLKPVLPESVQHAFDQTLSSCTREALSLLYVTLTRAIHALHVLLPPGVKRTSRSAAGLVAAAVSDSRTEDLPPDEVIWSCGDPNWFTGMSFADRLSAEHRPVVIPTVRTAPMTEGRRRGLARRSPSTHAPPAPSAEQRPSRHDPAADAVDARVRGSIIHAWFEDISWLPDDVPDPARLPDVLTRPDLRNVRLTDAQMKHLADEFLAMLEQDAVRQTLSRPAAVERLAHSQIGRNLSEQCLQVAAERPFAFRQDGQIVQGIIDRLVTAHSDGTVVAAEIIDYKTDRAHGNLQDWVADRVSLYRGQLNDYRTAVVNSLNLSPEAVRCSLLLLDAGVLADVS